MRRAYGHPYIQASDIMRKPEQDTESASVYGADVASRQAQRGEIGVRIEALLESRGWTIARLVKESGVPRSTINDILRGVSRQPQRLREIATALGVPYDSLDPEAERRITPAEVESILLESPAAALLEPPYGPEDRAHLERLGTWVWQNQRPTPRQVLHAVEWGRELRK